MQVALVTAELPDELVPVVAATDAPLVDALRARGVEVATPRWDDPDVDWSRSDLAVVRTTWDYTARRDDFVAWAAEVARTTSLWNPAEVLRWNTHKSYLLELEERGAPVVPTAWLARGDRASLGELLASRDWRRAVVKPAVAVGSEGLLRVDAAEAGPTGPGQAHLDALLASGDVMVQPYLETVEREGEVSVILVDGQVSHVVRKRPAAGEFRIQEQYGGLYERVDVDGEGAAPAALARWVVEAAGHELLFARVDLLRADDGAWQLAELELTEPDLYLQLAPEAGDRLADAIVARA